MRFRRVLCAVLLLVMAAAALPVPGDTALAAARYYITVDLTNQIVTVYDNGNTTESGIARQMICSSGKAATPTPVGTYTLPGKSYASERTEWYYFAKYNCYAKWATRIVGGILFHSVLYTAAKKGPTSSSVNALGGQASHGCIRLRVADAQWIAQNCPAGTQCRIYKSGKTNSDLRKRLLKKSFSRASESYDQFMGRKTELLARGSRGELVTRLQKRLTALGFLNDVADGIFGGNTETAVKRFQAACGLTPSGEVRLPLWKAIFADGAPTGTWVPLSDGMEGPAVAALQGALIRLKLYDGAADGDYDGETVQAVKRYQSCFTDDAATGKASAALQKAIFARADSVTEEFGDREYRLVSDTVEVPMAKIKGISKAKLFAKSSTASKVLAKPKRKTAVSVLQRKTNWSKVRYQDVTGYIKNKYLQFYTDTAEVYTYADLTEPTATPEVLIPTAEPTATPEIFIPTPTPEIFIPTVEPTAKPTATPESTAQPTVTPEPTATPDAAAQPTEAPEPTAEPTATPAWDWTFVLGPEGEPACEDAPDPAASAGEADVGEVAMPLTGDNTHAPAYAVARPEGAPLYALPDTGATVLATLPGDAGLEVLRLEDGWITVLYQQGAAYLRMEDARLADAAPRFEPGLEAAEPTARPEDGVNGLQIEVEAAPEESDDMILEEEVIP